MGKKKKIKNSFSNASKDDISKDPLMNTLKILPNTLDKVAEKIAPLLGYDLSKFKKKNKGK